MQQKTRLECLMDDSIFFDSQPSALHLKVRRRREIAIGNCHDAIAVDLSRGITTMVSASVGKGHRYSLEMRGLSER